MASQIQSFLARGAQMYLVLAVAPAVAGITRKVKARLMRRQGPPVISATAIS